MGTKGGECAHGRLAKGVTRVVSKGLLVAGLRGGDRKELLKLAWPLSPASYFFVSSCRLPTTVELVSISVLCADTNLSNLLHLISREVVLDFCELQLSLRDIGA